VGLAAADSEDRATARIERVSYRTGLVERPGDAEHLPAITIEAADVPEEDVLALIDCHLLDLGGTYGDPNAGDPIQYDELRIERDQGDVEIVVYNRAVLLLMTDSDAVRRIHQVCCRLEGPGGIPCVNVASSIEALGPLPHQYRRCKRMPLRVRP
jgi:hypothetical protein